MMRFLYLAAALVSACASPADKDSAAPAGGQDDGDDSSVEDGYEGVLPSGEYLLGFAVAPVNNLLVPFQAVFTPTEEGETPGIAALSIAPTSASFEVGDVVANVTDIPVEVDGSFFIDLGTFVLPGAYAPTGSDVELTSQMTGVLGADGRPCGDLSGEILTFGIALEGSTFGTVPWSAREDGAEISCDGGGDTEEIPRITECPTLAAGTVTGFPSGGSDRAFELILPDGYDAAVPAPVVFAFHGIGQSPDQFIVDHPLGPAVSDAGAILVVPYASETGGTVAWDPYSDPATNPDLVFFDDMLTCVEEQFAVDPDRVHVMGFSNGGLVTGMLLTLRSNVVASAAPFSGGLGQTFPDDARPIPTVVSWGGESDVGSGTNFDTLADEMLTELGDRGHPIIACDHGLEHVIDEAWWPWVMRFFEDHPLSETGAPYAGGLPDVFPDWCIVPQ